MTGLNIEKITKQWKPLSTFLSIPQTEFEYDTLVDFLDNLIDTVGNDEDHPLASLMDLVGSLIEKYDNEHYPFSEGNPIEALKYLMQENGLTQMDLQDMAGQDVVSGILSNKISLNIDQIQFLSEKFNVSPLTML